jgi:predicted Rossmann fold flavoprotein
LDTRLLRDFEKYSNRDLINSLDDLLPQKIIPVIISCAGIPPRKKVREITREERKRLLSWMKNFTVTVRGTRGYKEAVITSGGICVDEMDPSTMASKHVKGLYFVGEALDVDGLTGGFNLQIAFSTGWLAGSGLKI